MEILCLNNLQGKIRKVHAAAREGSLRDLQAALDRRKFSTAKDEISPNGNFFSTLTVKKELTHSFMIGTTPLHVAIIFGHTGMLSIDFNSSSSSLKD